MPVKVQKLDPLEVVGEVNVSNVDPIPIDGNVTAEIDDTDPVDIEGTVDVSGWQHSTYQYTIEEEMSTHMQFTTSTEGYRQITFQMKFNVTCSATFF